MSSTAFSQQNSSSIQTRRTPAKNDDTENSSQRPSNRRSLSGKFRNLFQKNSSSPSRSSQNDGRSAPASTRQRSPSPEPVRASTEAPHLRAPIIPWPFGKKKSKSTATTTTTTTKRNGKSKKTSPPSMEISSPIYQQEHQTSIRGQNFVPRTPELTHGATGRTQSSSSYENTTKGFRDYTIIDRRKSSEQEIGLRVDATTSPPYQTDRSRSPSLDHQHLPDTSIEHSYHYDTSSPRISEIETISIPKQPHTIVDTSSYTTTQVLVENTPVLPLTNTQSTTSTMNSNQWKNTSHDSLNNTELRSTTTSGSMDVTIPKLQTPLIPLSSRSSKKDSKRITFQSQNDDTYSSSSTVNNLIETNRSSSTKTYGSLPDTSTMNNNDTFTSWKSTKSDMEKYPGISAIIEHHMRPSSVRFNERSPTTSSQRTQRFDTSTATVNDYEQQQQQQPQSWSATLTNGSAPSPSSIHHHDSYIRPLTPEKPSLQPDVSMLHVNLDDLRGQSSHYHSPDPPIIYRSSTTIYTRDKHNYADGGELRTWNAQRNDDIDDHRKVSTSVQIFPSKITHDYPYNPSPNEGEYIYDYERQRQQQYSTNRYSNQMNNSSYTQSSISTERDRINDQSTRSYKDNDYTQESLYPVTPVRNSEVALRHYTLKRTNSYDGLGILISADIETHLNHRIRDIERDSPGSRSGLRKNDRIIHVNGINVEKTDFTDVLLLIKQGLNNNNLQFSVINESTFI